MVIKKKIKWEFGLNLENIQQPFDSFFYGYFFDNWKQFLLMT